MNAQQRVQLARYATFDLRTRIFVHWRVFQYRRAMYSKAGMQNFIDLMDQAEKSHGPTAAIWIVNASHHDDEVMIGSSNGYRLYKNPAFIGTSLAKWLPFSKRLRERVFGQIIADMREEVHEAVELNDPHAHRLALWRGRIAIFWALVKLLADGAAKVLSLLKFLKFFL